MSSLMASAAPPTAVAPAGAGHKGCQLLPQNSALTSRGTLKPPITSHFRISLARWPRCPGISAWSMSAHSELAAGDAVLTVPCTGQCTALSAVGVDDQAAATSVQHCNAGGNSSARTRAQPAMAPGLAVLATAQAGAAAWSSAALELWVQAVRRPLCLLADGPRLVSSAGPLLATTAAGRPWPPNR